MGTFCNVLFLGLLTLARAEFPFDHDLSYVDEETANTPQSRNDERFRLAEDFDPIHCEIEITPYFTNAPAGKTNFTFDGKATLMIKALKENLTTVTVHDNLRSIENVIITEENGSSLQSDTTYERDSELQFLIVTSVNKTFVKDRTYKMVVTYVGNINETPLSRGMFRGHYKDENGTVRWYSATHLQPTHSRQLFPSFDEPGFKSTFDIIVHRPATFSPTFSNMKIKSSTSTTAGRVKEVFETTARMSAYLISIHISDGFKVIADNNNQTKSYRIIARPTAAGQGQYALEVGQKLTAWFDQYLGIAYYNMFEGIKNDQLATPYWASGATENWGLVSYRELRLLHELNETNSGDKMSIATITSHELAHKWFGNYITCRWWDNVWINEGFASYFEYFAMDGVDKDMELEDQFNIMYLQSALSADSSVSTRALRHTVNTPAQVTGHFSGISYTKGASFLLMLKHLVTENIFKKALNRFLNTRAFQHAFPEDIYDAFTSTTTENNTLPSGVDITSFMSYWVDQPGYPVLNVDVNRQTGTITLSQERYYSSAGPKTNQTWPLPLTFTSGAEKNFDNLKAARVMTTETMKLENQSRDDYFIFNLKQKAIYRVNYDVENWNHIREDLLKDHTTIHHLNRAQIVDDIFAFMQSKKLEYKTGFDVLRFLKNDTSYYSWYPAISGFNRVRNLFLRDSSALEEYDKILHTYLDAVIKDVGYDVQSGDTLTKTLNRIYILAFACNIGHPGCVEDSVKKFRSFVDPSSNVKIDPDLRRHVYCTGLRQGSYDDWRYIRELWEQSNNQAAEIAMLRTLGCTSNTTAINEFLEMVISEEELVKAQDKLNAISWLYAGHKDNAKQTLAFLKKDNNLDRLRNAFAMQSWFQSAVTSIASYLDKDGLNEMKSWIEEKKDSIPEHQAIISAISSAETAMAQEDETKQILEALRDSAAALVPTMMLLITTFVALVLK